MKNVLAIGDAIIDYNIYCTVCDEVAAEAPVLIAQTQSEEMRLGGILNVAANIRALGNKVTVLSVVGDDCWSNAINDMARERGIDTYLISSSAYKTLVKRRYFDDNGRCLFRNDCGYVVPMLIDTKDAIINYITSKKNNYDALVVVDNGEGTIDSYLSDVINEIDIPVFADLKPLQLGNFTNLEALMPNIKEAREHAGNVLSHNIVSVERTADVLAEYAKTVLITLGKDGMYLRTDFVDKYINIPAMVRKPVIDPCGCGDIVTAVYTHCILEGYDEIVAAKIANHLAAAAVDKVGVICVDRQEYNKVQKLYAQQIWL